jgi:predicted acyl esterase
VEPGNASDEVLSDLVTLGCSYEGANGYYIAVNVPPGVELSAVRDHLIKCGATWEHADPTYSELHPEKA